MQKEGIAKRGLIEVEDDECNAKRGIDEVDIRKKSRFQKEGRKI